MSVKRVCDVCGKEIGNIQIFWRLREMDFSHFLQKRDICNVCMNVIADMCKAKREGKDE